MWQEHAVTPILTTTVLSFQTKNMTIFIITRSYIYIYIYIYIQGVTGGMCETSGECSLGQTIPI